MQASNEFLLLLGLVVLPASLGWTLGRLWRRTRSRPARWTEVVAGNLLLLGVLLSGTMLLGELYVRFGYDTTDSLGYTKVCKRWMERHWQVNSAQCRDNIQYYPSRAAGVRRVTFFGDSFTAGHGIKNVEDRFVNRVRRDLAGWEVHALAQPGHDTADEITLLRSCLDHRYALDLVVLVYCLNDVSDLVPDWTKAREQIFAERDQPGWLKDHSYLINLLHSRYQAARNPWMRHYYEFVQDTATGPIWEQQRARLDEFQRIVEAHQGRLLVVTFPFLHAVGADYPFQKVHDALAAHWRERNVPNLDLLPVYRNEPVSRITVNRFDAHPNEYAHRLATEAMVKFLREQAAAAQVKQP